LQPRDCIGCLRRRRRPESAGGAGPSGRSGTRHCDPKRYVRRPGISPRPQRSEPRTASTRDTDMKQTLALKLLFGMALTLGSLPAYAQPQPTAVQPGFTANGERACLTCHGGDPKVTAILQSPMALKGDPRTPFATEGCEGCHGPSADH